MSYIALTLVTKGKEKFVNFVELPNINEPIICNFTTQDELINLTPTEPDEAIMVYMCKEFDALTFANMKVLKMSLQSVVSFELLPYESIKELHFHSIVLNCR